MHTNIWSIKKIKNILLPETKNDISDFIQNEEKQKINLHNQEEYQTVVDKKWITNLEKEIAFLKSEITTKNEIIKKLLNNDIPENKSCNMVGGWGGQGTVILLTKQVTASLRAVQVTQRLYSRI